MQPGNTSTTDLRLYKYTYFSWLAAIPFFLADLYIDVADQYQYLGNCPPTPPLTKH